MEQLNVELFSIQVDFYEVHYCNKKIFLSLFLRYGVHVGDIEESERLKCQEANSQSFVQTQQACPKLCLR
jgi:hypothetical protein